jgi:hypothetical protein
LQLAVVVERDRDIWLVIDDRRAGQRCHSFHSRANAEGLSNKLVLIAAIIEIEPQHQIKGLAIKGAHREGVGGNF